MTCGCRVEPDQVLRRVVSSRPGAAGHTDLDTINFVISHSIAYCPLHAKADALAAALSGLADHFAIMLGGDPCYAGNVEEDDRLSTARALLREIGR